MPTSKLSFALPWAFIAVLGGCGDDQTPTQQAPLAAITWKECGAGLECASFLVPKDHDVPSKEQFTIPLVRRPASNPATRIGSLLVNPGGPGGSGVAWVQGAWVALPIPLKERFDLVGFDPRGQASSTPGIDCADDLDSFVSLDLTPDDGTEKQAIVDQTDKLVAGCEARSKDILPYVGTNQIVRDMDMIREALGDEKLTYIGLSYGTFLGAMYAETFPDRVRALVLDGALDPSLTGEQFIEGQAIAFEAELEAFLDDCTADVNCAFHSGGDPRAAYDAILASIEAAPMPAGGGRKLGPGEFSYAVSARLYRTSSWKSLAEALALASSGDGSKLLGFSDGYVGRNADGTYENSLDVYYGVTSIDTVFAKDPAVYEAMTTDLLVKAPRLGATLPYTAFPSSRWPTPPWRTPGPVSADGAPPILVVSATGDPATPHEWGVALAAQLSSGVLLTREGLGHVSFLKGVTCIDQAITDYLVDLKLPADGTICK